MKMIKFSKITWLAIVLIIAVFIITTGFFAYQWWQMKRELAKQIAQNENLTKQIDELQKQVEELKAAKEEIIDETTDWKTYRNEKFGFEIDYPTVGWEFKNGAFCRVLPLGPEKDKENFCIFIGIRKLYPDCADYSWEEIFASGVYTKEYPGGEDCIFGYNKGGKFEKEIITNFGVRGYKGRTIISFGPLWGPLSELKSGDGCNSKIVVYTPLKGEIISNGRKFLPLLDISYTDCPSFIDYSEREIKIFEMIFSSVRFIEE